MRPRIAAILASLIFGNAQAYPPTDIRSLSEGTPHLAQTHLSPQSYLPVPTQRFAKAKVIWVNWELLREMGVEMPASGMTPAFEEKILAAFAWGRPQPQDPAEAFIPGTKKTFYADGYGGIGMNGNLGSGRAASAGLVQIKGIGQTPMVYKPDDFGHSHGGASLEESIREAIWSEVLHHELPYGANRVLAILSTGTITHTWNPIDRERALVVRIDPLRPAHYLTNDSAEGDRREWDIARVASLQNKLIDGLPAPAEDPQTSSLAARLREFANRVAHQHATAYSKGLYHGATSPSNIGLNGEFLDFGTMTALAGFERVLLLADDMPFGDTEVFKRDLLFEIMDDFRKNLPADLRAQVPSNAEIGQHFDARYAWHLRRAMLLLTGVPAELLEPLLREPAAAALADELVRIARAGNDRVIRVRLVFPRYAGKYHLGSVLRSLVTTLARDNPSPAVDPLERRFADFFALVRTEAEARGIGISTLSGTMRDAVDMRNTKLARLIRDRFSATNVLQLIKRKLTGSDAELGKFIDDTIAASRRETPPSSVAHCAQLFASF